MQTLRIKATEQMWSLVKINSCDISRNLLQNSRFRSFSSTVPLLSQIKDVAVHKSETEVTETEDVADSGIDTLVAPPVILGRKLDFPNKHREPRQVWVDNLDAIKERKLGIIDLHPDVFGAFPNPELISSNAIWQTLYKKVNWDWTPSRADMIGGGRKPWPQKGLGKARHGSVRSPIWKKGSKTHGPKGPKTYFWMLQYEKRVQGLCATLSVKLAQDDLKIVDSLDNMPTEDPKFLEDLVEQRKWGVSVLFVDESDIMPRNITLATDTTGQFNLMPVYGLNVYSMLKHETLVLTIAAVNKIEERLLYHLNPNDPLTPAKKFRNTY